MKKDIAVLYIYQRLMDGHTVCFEEMVPMLECSERTFSRYIADIKNYLSVYHIGKKVFYDSAKKGFLIKEL
jgi:predicted DNA-binding transcriptional regulator YafY